MADWIKMRVNLITDPRVIDMATFLKLPELHVVGMLFCIWAWADQHSIDGTSLRVSEETLDRFVSCPGFCIVLRKVGWLEGRATSLSFPRFAEHNGQTAKNRALTSKRVSRHRGGGIDPDVTLFTLPEERRGDKKKPPDPLAGGGRSSESIEQRERCLPERWKNIPKTDRKRISVLKNTPMMVRMGGWFNRREDTLWNLEEGIALLEVRPKPEAVELLEEYYLADIDPDHDHRRKNLITLLNNWNGELDRANGWKVNHQ